MTRSLFSGLLGLALAVVLAMPAQAQPSRDATPQIGPVQATAAGAAADIEAGGTDRNAIRGSGCSGYINNGAPVATVQNSASGPLSIYVTSGTDTTLLVAAPDGEWHCSDDANESNPAVTIQNAAPGSYTVWVGTFSPGSAGAAAKLYARNGPPAW